MLDVIEKAAEKAGGVTKLATALGVRHQTFYSWKRVPAERVLDVERASGVPRHELRPDLFPRPAADPETIARSPLPHHETVDGSVA